MEHPSSAEKDEFHRQLDYMTKTMEYILTLLSRQGEMGNLEVQAHSSLVNYKIGLLLTKVDKLQAAFNLINLKLKNNI